MDRIQRRKNALRKIISALEVLEETEGDEINFLYASYDDSCIPNEPDEVEKKFNEINEIINLKILSTIDNNTNSISNIQKEIIVLDKAIKSLRDIIRPDETDVHNINRRIDILAQKIATLESKKGWFK